MAAPCIAHLSEPTPGRTRWPLCGDPWPGDRPQQPLPHRVGDHINLAVVVPLVADVAVCPGKELGERRGLVPGVALAAAWVFGLGS